MTSKFQLASDFAPAGDQAQAIEKLTAGLKQDERYQTLLGVTGSGKTFTMANVIQAFGRPTLIMTHNKTLATQLYHEFKEFFPHNAVEYFVSYYDYYQPEAYIPRTDLFIEKDTSINDELDKLRLSATRSLFEREDVIIISSVSCIYGLGSPEAYSGMLLYLMTGQERPREEIIAKLVEIQYDRNLYDFHRGTFRVRGDSVEVFPAYDDDAIRIQLFGDEIESITRFDPLTGSPKENLTKIAIYPSSHYVQPKDQMPETLALIQAELQVRLKQLTDQGKLVEFQRLDQRVRYDMEMLEETGRCPGVENYSRIMSRRGPGQAPPTLIDYFPKNSLLIMDESHVTLPQIGGMYKGDRSRKETLVEYGFRLPSALDNRPLRYEEFDGMIERVIYVSATPGELELQNSKGKVVEQIIRPTGLLDPQIEIRPTKSQVDEMYGEIQKVVAQGERVLITTLTKRMAEDLAQYYKELGVKVKYLHSDIDTVERAEIIRNLRLGEFDVLIGINLLREGLDLPEVSLVAIFDADKEGFLRSHRSLLQTCGRAARNLNGRVIMFADTVTRSMQQTLTETRRRREIQDAFNQANGITPQGIKKRIQDHLVAPGAVADNLPQGALKGGRVDMKEVRKLEKEMRKAAERLEFEEAARLRDQILKLKQLDLELT
ncbi:MAG: excinuclease ABC subunit B [Candidatus Lambdaproteobacteria bacterium RIFOXYD1_FULL_56_27]|uniref:UvrABC system protein B n=1 Tax=Candidatus Lambdaproteobacteria bacterium RIFOXYD2_FULL_56_26 TaxID=1817773 RepID=A0A1F6GSA2_9PROT|nr:MAG: excinuclease ABC subunit B [Candidatus Lambdaproteobacteria bacterium RIFOXYC1_FULL_56_13]OGH00881.1 MAG: excinuclease ABC subunit B [Candidatus Lambdaproteobacteria bacterium RIFOXYD2_FULL_56_26]OGH08131.1 MAG: excinuclease ABC subunit B [Candidatus Lambdaproteobacteria bacterium RIFOXYD1_FULL_56_27]